MNPVKIKSYAKVNLALNIIGKNQSFHKIESIIAFVDLYDLILIRKIKSKTHKILFTGKFSSTSPAIWVIAILSVISFAVA